MSGQTGHGQSFKFGTMTIPHVESVRVMNKGRIITKTVADLAYDLSVAAKSAPKFTVNFVVPSTGAAALMNAIDQAAKAAIDAGNIAGVLDYNAAEAYSEGPEVSSPSGDLAVCSVVFTVSGSMTVADSA